MLSLVTDRSITRRERSRRRAGHRVHGPTEREGGTMYGTIARMKVKKENLEALRAWAKEAETREVPGFRAAHVLIPDHWNDDVIVAVMLEDKGSYDKNA